MWSRTDLESRLARRAVLGMIHLRPLPGSPLFAGSMQKVIDAALADAREIAAGGADGLVIENFGDRPFRKGRVDAETVSAMTAVLAELRRESALPFGVNVLRNDAFSALAIASVTGALFVRVNVLVGAMLTDQGIIEGEADEVMRRRGNVAVFADHLVKHAAPLAPFEPIQLARDLRLRAMADAIIVSGKETGAAADLESLEALRRAIDAPLLVGSGLTSENAADYARFADGAIVGTSIKKDGDVDAPVERHRVAAVVDRFKKG
jgi:membrane complex biogenesis BtpA family protein